MNFIFFALVSAGFLSVAWQQFLWVPASGVPAPMEKLSAAIIQAAAGSVELAFGLIGIMALFLGLTKVAEQGGMLALISRIIRPFMKWLFPEVPPDHPATGAMILNFSANLLGLGNAATPFGIRAMQELDKLNPSPGTATNSMVLFVAINTAGITLLPASVIALRAAAGSSSPAAILPTTLFASFCATVFAVFATRIYQRFFPFPAGPGRGDGLENGPGSEAAGDVEPGFVVESSGSCPLWVSCLAAALLVAAVPLMVVYGRVVAPWAIPAITVGFLAFGAARKVRVYEVFVEGAKEGFQVAVKIIPYLVAILVAVAMLRAGGVLDAAASALGGVTAGAGLPPEGVLMALMRPLSGSGAYGLVASIIKNPAVGPDSYTGYLVSTMQGSSETTFYVLAVYFGAVRVRRMRHALAAGLTAELVAVVAAVAACRYLYG